jgi:plasmid stabilization system protein ParE
VSGYRLTITSRRRLDEILDYSMSRWGVARAEAYLRDIHLTLQAVSRKERRARVGERYGAGLSFIRSGSHYIFLRYDAVADLYDVVDVLHQSMDFRRHLKTSVEGE